MENINSILNLDCNGKISQIRVIEEQVVVTNLLKSTCTCDSNWEDESEEDWEEEEDDDVCSQDDVIGSQKDVDDDVKEESVNKNPIDSNLYSVVGETNSPHSPPRVLSNQNGDNPDRRETSLASRRTLPHNSNRLMMEEGELIVDLCQAFGPHEPLGPKMRLTIQELGGSDDLNQVGLRDNGLPGLNGPCQEGGEASKDKWEPVPCGNVSGPVSFGPKAHFKDLNPNSQKNRQIFSSAKKNETKKAAIKSGKPRRSMVSKPGSIIFRAAAVSIMRKKSNSSTAVSSNGTKRRKRHRNDAKLPGV